MQRLGIVVWVSLATVFSNTMVWPPMYTWGGMANMIGKLQIMDIIPKKIL